MPRAPLAPGTHGDFSFTELDDGRVLVIVRYCRFDGKKKRAKTVAASKAAGKRALNERLPRLMKQTDRVTAAVDEESLTVSELAELYFENERVTERIMPQTVNENERLYRSVLAPRMAALRVADVTPLIITRHYQAMHKQYPSQARNAKAVLSGMFGWAQQMGWLPENPVSRVKSAPRRKKPIVVLEADARDALRRAVHAYHSRPDRMGPVPSNLLPDVIEVTLATGGRIGEVLGLRWVDVDMLSEAASVRFRGAIKEGNRIKKHWSPYLKTAWSERSIPLNETATGIIMRRFAEQDGPCEYVFHTATGAPNGPQDVHRALRAVRAWAKLDDTWIPHTLRKTSATEVARMLGVEAAALFLGHKGTRTALETYIEPIRQAPDVREVTAKLNAPTQPAAR